MFVSQQILLVYMQSQWLLSHLEDIYFDSRLSYFILFFLNRFREHDQLRLTTRKRRNWHLMFLRFVSFVLTEVRMRHFAIKGFIRRTMNPISVLGFKAILRPCWMSLAKRKVLDIHIPNLKWCINDSTTTENNNNNEIKDLDCEVIQVFKTSAFFSINRWI